MTEVNTVTPVRAQDRVSDVLARDESLVEVFVRCAPHFSKLRNRAMRRVMARLVTVEQAARTAQVPVERLLHDLNEALGLPDESVPASAAPPIGEGAGVAPNQGGGVDASAAVHPPSAPVVELDVRDDLRAGREPFSKIQATVARLADGEVLHLRAIFEPIPLYTVLGKRGFVHETQQHAPDDWSVWFWRPAAVPHQPGAPSPAVETPAPNAEHVVVLDVRGLNPPEPLMRTMAALETLPPGHVLVQINSRVPQFLLPLLAERGFAWEVDESQPDRVQVRIWAAQQDQQAR